MALFTCKMCGGALEVKEGMSVCECQYCGTMQTIPNLDDEKKIRLYDRANHFRRNNEFDKAMGIYESILAEDDKDAEAYWSLVLCRYGIEYVEDPTTHKRVPTVNRAQYTSVFIDEDYQSALKYADGYQRDVYEAEAKVIDEIQKGILEISNKEDPFDVFICYKETDENNNRTQDSVFANDIYKALTDEGYKVFFSRITLEDKLGTEYEPYIFAALNSAPVMVVVGTCSENLNAVWVKNEWSRYLSLVKAGENKTLIPVYKDMDPYDLPEEFSYLQAQDMNKVGFMQDLVRGVKKIISQDVIDERQKKGTSSVIVDTMTKRGSEALANSDWDTAVRCYDSILDYDSRNIDALMGKLKASKQTVDLTKSKTALEGNSSYEQLIKIADEELKKSLIEVNQNLKKKNKKKKSITIIGVIVSVLIVTGIIGCIVGRPVYLYNKANERYQRGDYLAAYDIYKILDYKDSSDRAKECLYLEAKKLLEKKEYQKAAEIFTSIPKYEDSDTLVLECKYLEAVALLDNERYDEALKRFNEIIDYKDSNELSKQIVLIKKINDIKNNQHVISAGVYISAGITNNGKVITTKINDSHFDYGEANVERWSNIIAVSAGSFHTVGLKSDGTVVATGENSDGRCDVNSWNNIIEISAGYDHTLGLKKDGTVIATGNNESGQCDVSKWKNIVAISVGNSFSVGLKEDGTVVATGDNFAGQCNISTWKNIVSVSTGDFHTVGLKEDGTVIAVGDDWYGQTQVNNWTDIISIDAGASHTVGLKEDGTVIAVGQSRQGSCKVSTWKDIIAISAGGSQTLGLKSDGTVISAVEKDEDNGQADVGTWNSIKVYGSHE